MTDVIAMMLLTIDILASNTWNNIFVGLCIGVAMIMVLSFIKPNV